MQIVDRIKNLIKSGGEWISSLDLENAATMHPEVSEAAAIAVPHPRWDERPIVIAVLAPDGRSSDQDLREFMASKLPKWCVPDRVVIRPVRLPRTATGKVDKVALRREYGGMTPVERGLTTLR